MTKEEMMDQVFWHCVDILNVVASWLGVTYEELNIWVFIVIQPAIIVVLTMTLIWQQWVHKKVLKQSGTANASSLGEKYEESTST